jgi:manganese/zinc/iron transport system ATP- binding protein
MTEPYALSTSHLTVNYDQTPVLWDINVDVPAGRLIGIIGPNGAGKTTFIKAVLELVPSLSGKVDFFNEPLAKVRRRVAYVPQRETVEWDFPITVKDLVLMGRYGQLGLLRWPREADLVAVDHYLGLVGMKEYKNRQISQLSGGQKQRVFIARALLQEADIYFMDEPFSGIDLGTEKTIVQLLRQLQEKGKTVFVVHHDLNTVESYFDWLIMLNMRLVANGPVKEVFNQDTLHTTYGKSYSLLDEALKLSQQKTKGMQ